MLLILINLFAKIKWWQLKKQVFYLFYERYFLKIKYTARIKKMKPIK